MPGRSRPPISALTALLIVAPCAREAPRVEVSTTVRGLDTDSDGMDDGWETTHFGGLSRDGTGDEDADGILDLEEFESGLDPNVDDGLEDLDGDRYPNVFEIRQGSDPTDGGSLPTANITVSSGGGADFETLGEAVWSADPGDGDYQIISVGPGTYTHLNDSSLAFGSTYPNLLVIGAGGADETIFDGGGSRYGWSVTDTTVVFASLTLKRFSGALWLNSGAARVHLNDVVFTQNSGGNEAGAIHVYAGTELRITGSAFVDNTSVGAEAEQLQLMDGDVTLRNTIVWGDSSEDHLHVDAEASLVAVHSLVKDETLPGTGNLSGSTDPLVRADGRLLPTSPLRAAGATVTGSLLDMDLEERPTYPPDIGADQFVDSDTDDLADAWEMNHVGSLGTLTSLGQEYDSDGLDNEEEYEHLTDPTDDDTDGDAVSDGAEVDTHGTDPLSTDSDRDGMLDGWEIDHGLDPLVDDALDDPDGDRYPNLFEHQKDSDPQDDEDTPAADALVDPNGGGDHETISAAISSASGAAFIIHLAPGTYLGLANLALTVYADDPAILILGVEGGARTLLDAEDLSWGASVLGTLVLGSLRIERTVGSAIWTFGEAELVLDDVVITGARASGVPGALYIQGARRVYVRGSALLDNTGYTEQLVLSVGTLHLTNSVLWGSGETAQIYVDPSATLVAAHSLARDETLTGTGNLSGATDPLLRFDGRALPSSPLLGAGGDGLSSRLDLDQEPRPSTAPDIGVDQWLDDDSDDLPDGWEIAVAGDLETLDGGDSDGDGLADLDEYYVFAARQGLDPTNPDTDGDSMLDGDEILLGTDPFVPDVDLPICDLNEDGLLDGIGAQLGYSASETDDDGDGLTNALERSMGTDPLRSDTDGDGHSDASDAFPLDPEVHALPSSPSDTTPPVITLTTPANASLVP